MTGPEDLLVDIALDSQPGQPPTMSVAGPTYAPQELAARKVVALFDRFAARDFVDVFALTPHVQQDSPPHLGERPQPGVRSALLHRGTRRATALHRSGPDPR